MRLFVTEDTLCKCDAFAVRFVCVLLTGTGRAGGWKTSGASQ